MAETSIEKKTRGEASLSLPLAGGDMTAEQLTAMLRAAYPPREYAFFAEVRNRTGYGSVERYADALALGLWPSRGMLLHGFEIKVSRRDWMRERNDPAKAEAVARYCDTWSLVVAAPTIVEKGELPAGWGLFAPDDRPRRAGRLRMLTEAVTRKPEPLDRKFVASVLRHFSDATVPRATLEAEIQKRLDAVRQREAVDYEQQESRRRRAEAYDRLHSTVEAFEQASGVRIASAWSPEAGRVGGIVRAIIEGGIDGQALRERLAGLRRNAEAIRADLDRHLNALDADLNTASLSAVSQSEAAE